MLTHTPYFFMMQLDVFSHGFKVSRFNEEEKRYLVHFAESLQLREPKTIHEGKRVFQVEEIKKRFYGMTDDQKNFFFHIYHMEPLFKYLLDAVGWTRDRFVIHEHKPKDGAPLTVDLSPTFVPRDYQETIIESLIRPIQSSGLFLRTGGGKSSTSLYAIHMLGERFVINIPPKYFGLWKESLGKIFPNFHDRYLTVSGSQDLKALINLGLEGRITQDIIIVSNVTYRSFIDAYEKFGDRIKEFGWNTTPHQFHETIGASLQLNDEFQDDPGLVFRIDIFTNVKKQIYLSATPYTGNDMVTRMINVMLPEETLCPLPGWEKHTDVISLHYHDNVKKKDYLTPFKNSYNHARYEKQMMKAPRRMEAYLKKLQKITNGVFVKDFQPGQKLLILCATVDFIHRVTKFLKVAFPKLRVGFHVSGSKYDDLLKNDITVSTIKSSGTGVDIPGLKELIACHAVDSEKDNIQVLGRLRYPIAGFPDLNPRMVYMVCDDIKPHVKYDRSKFKYFRGKVRSHRSMRI